MKTAARDSCEVVVNTGRAARCYWWQRHRPVAPSDPLGWQAARTLRRLAILANVGSPIGVLETREVQATARKLGLEAATSEIRQAEDFTPAFDTLRGRAEALYVVRSPLLTTNWI